VSRAAYPRNRVQTALLTAPFPSCCRIVPRRHLVSPLGTVPADSRFCPYTADHTVLYARPTSSQPSSRRCSGTGSRGGGIGRSACGKSRNGPGCVSSRGLGRRSSCSIFAGTGARESARRPMRCMPGTPTASAAGADEFSWSRIAAGTFLTEQFIAPGIALPDGRLQRPSGSPPCSRAQSPMTGGSMATPPSW